LVEFVMEHGVFRAWLAEVDDLTVDQRLELEEVLAGQPPRMAVTAVIEASLGDERRCPHCGYGASVGCGKADGLQRFRCKGCGRSFNALTGTPLARLRKKECWLDFGRSLSEGETPRPSGVAWRSAPPFAGATASSAPRSPVQL
jgi:rubredoxin